MANIMKGNENMQNIVVTLFLVVLVCTVGCLSAYAGAGRAACFGHECANCHNLSPNEAAELLRSLNVTVQSIKHAPIQGMFEVLAQRADQRGLIYIDYAKKHIMQGVIVDVATKGTVSTH